MAERRRAREALELEECVTTCDNTYVTEAVTWPRSLPAGLVL